LKVWKKKNEDDTIFQQANRSAQTPYTQAAIELFQAFTAKMFQKLE
jgi:hypothetical protein